MNDDSEKKEPVRGFQGAAYALALVGLNIALCLGALAMCVLLAAGFWQIGAGVWGLFSYNTAGRESGENPVHLAIQGIELLFLAPLGYFVVWGLIKYVHAATPKAGGSRHASKEVEARAELIVVKAFTVTLFIAIIATSLVASALGGSMNYELALSGSIVMAVLVAYFWLLERLAAELGGKQRSPGRSANGGEALANSGEK